MIIDILAVLTLLLVLGQLVALLVVLIIKKVKDNRTITIYGDVRNSLKEEVLFYIIQNAVMHEDLWKASVHDIKLFAAGVEIPSRAFKSADIPRGIRIAVVGLMNSPLDVIYVAGAVKYGLWEISYDGGTTRIPVKQISDKNNKKMAKIRAVQLGYTSSKGKGRISDLEIDPNALSLKSNPVHGLVAHVNEGKSTQSTLRYQIIVPDEHSIKKIIDEDPHAATFWHVHDGKLHELQCKFIENTGSMYEWDIIGLEPGSIYVGLSTGVFGGKVVLPSSALYGITKTEDGTVQTIDDSKLGRPVSGAKSRDIWSSKLLDGYLGPQLRAKMHAIIIKKHFEREHPEAFLSITRAHDQIDDYSWVLGKEEIAEDSKKILEIILKDKEKMNRSAEEQ